MNQTPIADVTDTAAWVATYRARESARDNALFHDPLARVLAGETGEKIAAEHEKDGAEWYVIVRTVIIDHYIQAALESGVDTIINLGAGLDTRPYRLDLPSDLLWIEVDYPKIIEAKTTKLQGEQPRCRLERIALDLAQADQRRKLFADLNLRCKKALILTEGVLPYLTEEQVASLGLDLRDQEHFQLWIVDYFSAHFMRAMKSRQFQKKMQNAPLLFAPRDWEGFYERIGWCLHTMKYIPAESKRLGRKPPYPWFFKIFLALLPAVLRRRLEKTSGFAMLRLCHVRT